MNSRLTEKTRSVFLKRTALVLIGICCYFYSIYAADFAELNVQLPFLDFPIFIGEILLFICVLLMGILFFKSPPRLNDPVSIAVIFYGAWVLLKALTGYLSMGTLSLRNAALFYYPFFALIGYIIFEREFWKGRGGCVVFIGILVILLAAKINDFYIFTYSMLALAYAARANLTWVRLAVVLIVAWHWYHSRFLLCSARSHLLGIAAAVIFLIGYFLFGLLKVRCRIKVFTAVGVVLVLTVLLMRYGDRNAVRSLTTFPVLIEQFRYFDKEVQLKKPFYTEKPIAVELFNENENNQFRKIFQQDLDRDVKEAQLTEQKRRQHVASVVKELSDLYVEKNSALKEELIAKCVEEIYTTAKEILDRESDIVIIQAQRKLADDVEKIILSFDSDIDDELQDVLQSVILRLESDAMNPVVKARKIVDDAISVSIKKLRQRTEEKKKIVVDNVLLARGERSLQVAYNNIYFRIFIWRDMLEELVRDKAFFGVNWGKPQRSPSIEILEWASVEWRRDGWITPHNSYLHMIYRGGIVGLAFVIGLLGVFVHLTRQFLRFRSVIGGLLLAALVYWAMIANFLVFFEFPYNAIPFWTLLGMTWAYAHSLSGQRPGNLAQTGPAVDKKKQGRAKGKVR